MADNDEQRAGIGHIASVMPQVQQAERGFHAAGSLEIPNSQSTINGVSASSFLNQVLPYANKASTMTIAEQQVAANSPAAAKEQA